MLVTRRPMGAKYGTPHRTSAVDANPAPTTTNLLTEPLPVSPPPSKSPNHTFDLKYAGVVDPQDWPPGRPHCPTNPTPANPMPDPSPQYLLLLRRPKQQSAPPQRHLLSATDPSTPLSPVVAVVQAQVLEGREALQPHISTETRHKL